MTPRIWSYGDVGEEDVPVRDRPYEHFGSQGYAMPDHARDDEQRRGAANVELGEPAKEPARKRDDRLREEISARLDRESELDDRELEVVVHDREATLTGRVHDPDERELAQHIAEGVPGVVS